jgi:molecular chaperone GrpE
MSEPFYDRAPQQEDAPAVAPVDPRDAEVVRLSADLAAARARVDELARAYQAGERDREAFKQRVQREREQLVDVEKGRVSLALIEAVDELDLCVSAADESALATGVRLIRENLLRKLEAMGVTRVAVVGHRFDPNLAEATGIDVTPEPNEDGTVLAVVRACYQLNNRVIRPGLVKVARYVKPADA